MTNYIELYVIKLVGDKEKEVNQRWQTAPKVKYQLQPESWQCVNRTKMAWTSYSPFLWNR